MKIIKYEYYPRSDSKWTNTGKYMILETLSDLDIYIKETKEYALLSLQNCIRAYSRDTYNHSILDIMAHYSASKLPHVAAIKALAEHEEGKCTFTHIEQVLLEQIQERYNTMKEMLNSDRQIHTNQDGGYGDYQISIENLPEWYKYKELEITENLTEEQIHNFIFRNDGYESAYSKNNIVYDRISKKCIYASFYHYTHEYICAKYKLNPDNCLKLIFDYYKECKYQEYGIKHITYSNVYYGNSAPFIPSKQDLDIIENTVKEICKKLKREY